jgi:hypothetical protein
VVQRSTAWNAIQPAARERLTMKKIWLSLAAMGLAATWLAHGMPLGAADTEAGFECLFDGKTLSGWEGKPEFWSVKDGAITGQTTAERPTKGNTFLIWRGGKVADFELRLKWRMVGGNSGIQYRSVDHGDFVVGGYQADMDSGNTYTGILYEERGRGIIAPRGQKVVISEGEGGKPKIEKVGATCDPQELLAGVKKEEWNDYVVIAQGNHLIQKINGITTVEVIDQQEAKRRMEGILALQLHAGPPMLVQFKDLRIKHLK